MSISRFFTVPVTITNPAGSTTTDGEGVPTTPAPSTSVLGHVQPLGSQAAEDRQLGVEVAERARLVWFPAGTPITHRSTVAFGGDTYEVAGDPKRWSVGSANDHVEIVAVRSQS